MTLRPDLTVAAIVERGGQFLLVEERVGNRMVFNQPAGHVERGEQFLEAAIRETLEETAWTFHPESLVGVYLWEQPDRQRSFLRVVFCGHVSDHDPERQLDRGIERTVWMSREQMLLRAARMRSPLVLRCIDDYMDGTRYPLDVVKHLLKDTSGLGLADTRSRLLDTATISRLL